MIEFDSEEERNDNGITCKGQVALFEKKNRKREMDLVHNKRTKSTSAFADIDLAPCVNPVNTIL